MTNRKPPFITLVLLISFASVNAVLYTPALPAIAGFFHITDGTAQLTMTWFLIGYALGQLLYGPIANRFGRKKALYAGVSLQILSSMLCIVAGHLEIYSLLVIGRFFLALGAGVGLKMTFTLIHETCDASLASKKIAHLMIAFAITPGLSTMLGGSLITYYSWMSTFYACAFYGFILLLLVSGLPETKTSLELDALQLHRLMTNYFQQFKNPRLIAGGLLMGSATSFVYVFAALAPFIAINLLHMAASNYGIANLLPPIGLILGSLFSARLVDRYSAIRIIRYGIVIVLIGSLLLYCFVSMNASIVYPLFMTMMIINFGLALIFANAASLSMRGIADKAHGSAVMNFINMGLATLMVLSLNRLAISPRLLPMTFIAIAIFMAILIRVAFHEKGLSLTKISDW